MKAKDIPNFEELLIKADSNARYVFENIFIDDLKEKYNYHREDTYLPDRHFDFLKGLANEQK